LILQHVRLRAAGTILAVVPDEVEEYAAALDVALPGRVEAVYLTGSVALGGWPQAGLK
jgi:hypothetical protein